MARTRYESLTSRLQISNIRGPSGIGAREASRTTSLLNNELTKMSNFFLKRAEAQAKIEGAEFGAVNTPTVDEYEKAIDDGRNPLEQFDRTTVFGSSAFNQVAKTLGNSLIVEAKKQMNSLALSADKKVMSISEFEKDLNITANGHYYKHGIKLNKITTAGLQSGATIILDTHLNNLDNEIFAILPKNTDEIDQKVLTQKIWGKGGIREKLLSKYSKTMIGARFERSAFKAGVKDWNKAFETNLFSTIKTLSFNNSKDLADITDDLRRGKATGDKTIDALVAGLSLDQRQRLATEIVTTANNQNQIEDLRDEENDKLGNDTASELEITITNDIQQGNDQATITSNLAKLKKLVDLDEANNPWEVLSKLNNKAGGERTVSDKTTLRDLTKKAGFGTLSFKELNDAYDKLIPKDFNSLLGTLNSQQTQGFTDAKTILAKELGFLVDREITDQDDPQYAKGEVFVQILGKLQEEEIAYNKTKDAQTIPFNHVARVKELAKADGELILQELFVKKRDSYKRNYFDTFAKEYPDLIPSGEPMTRANVLKMEDKLEDMLTDKKQRKGLFQSGNDKKEKSRIETYISITKSMLAEERFSE